MKVCEREFLICDVAEDNLSKSPPESVDEDYINICISLVMNLSTISKENSVRFRGGARVRAPSFLPKSNLFDTNL